ncbi:MAG: hypothetical protein HOO96_19655 [Polyangiaceae bacterium]|nr:hypothetical protein [Polyangiaceae bacterium]
MIPPKFKDRPSDPLPQWPLLSPAEYPRTMIAEAPAFRDAMVGAPLLALPIDEAWLRSVPVDPFDVARTKRRVVITAEAAAKLISREAAQVGADRTEELDASCVLEVLDAVEAEVVVAPAAAAAVVAEPARPEPRRAATVAPRVVRDTFAPVAFFAAAEGDAFVAVPPTLTPVPFTTPVPFEPHAEPAARRRPLSAGWWAAAVVCVLGCVGVAGAGVAVLAQGSATSLQPSAGRKVDHYARTLVVREQRGISVTSLPTRRPGRH